MRSSGVLMHISSLSSPWGIGTMGKAAREFVDFLVEAGQTYWQVLPLGPTVAWDSPYQSFSTFAGNPYLIDLDDLTAKGFLKREDYALLDWGGAHPDRVDFTRMHELRETVLRKAVQRFLKEPPADYEDFQREQETWLSDYALFMALRGAYEDRPWQEWPDPIRKRKEAALEEATQTYADEIAFWKAVQYFFFQQWTALQKYAHRRGIYFIGDLPIYVASDSVDVWANPGLFQLDKNLLPTEVAGCPPDDFAEDGQLWGNPLFRWERMRREKFQWWIARIAHQKKLCDILRIDHFRGFESYYAIPYGDKTACNGRWRPGPGMKLFRAVEEALGKQNFIAEDLGFLTDSVRKLLEDSGFPGMKVLEFGFDPKGDSDYLPHNYTKNCVAYVGTHDNNTALGWYQSLPRNEREFVRDYLKLSKHEGYPWGLMRGIWASAADTAIVQAQDLLGLGEEARMNEPSTVGKNWKWRALPGAFTPTLAKRLRRETELYRRFRTPDEKKAFFEKKPTTEKGESAEPKKPETTEDNPAAC